jgi:hypothetical protein
MANELFNALPDEFQQPAIGAARVALPPNSALSGNPYAAAPSPTAPAVPGLAAKLVEVSQGSYVATPDRGVTPDARSVAANPAPPIAPRAVPATGVTPETGSPFAFLADARPLYR